MNTHKYTVYENIENVSIYTQMSLVEQQKGNTILCMSMLILSCMPTH